jgi:hypothetical protein
MVKTKRAENFTAEQKMGLINSSGMPLSIVVTMFCWCPWVANWG